MRILLRVTLGFLGAAAICAWGPGSCALWAGLFLLPGLFLLRRHRTPFLLLTGLILGFLWFQLFSALVLSPVKLLEGQTRQLSLQVAEAEQREDTWITEGRAEISGRSYGVRLYLDQPVQTGDYVRGRFLLHSTLRSPDRPGTSLVGKGIWLTGSQQGQCLILPAPETLGTLPFRLREQILGRLESLFPQDVSGFAQALLLGRGDRLTGAQDWDLKVSGIRHVVAVSGLHAGILCLLLSFLVGKRPWAVLLVSIPCLGLFCAMTGFSPSVERAVVMILLMQLAMVLGRDYDSLTALSLAVLLLLLVNPLVVTSISFQLSAACVLGILTLGKRILERLRVYIFEGKGPVRTVKYWIFTSISVSLGALIAVTPLTALHFGTVSLISPLTNLLTVWLIPWIFWGILLVLAVSLISASVGAAAALPVSWAIRYVLGAARICGKFPLASLYTQSLPVLLWLGAVYVLGALLLCGRRRRPGIFAAVSGAGLVLALALSWIPPRTDAVRMTVLDVGQGQCILLQSRGKTAMVDCGGDRDSRAADLAAGTLLSQGISWLDCLILTHFDRDHVGGAELLLSRIPTDRIYLPVSNRSLPRDARICLVDPVEERSLGLGKLTLYGENHSPVPNENSLCVLFEADNYDILITGDRSREGELSLLREFSLPRVDCLVAGHHGAGDSTSRELLNRVQPDTAVISAGRFNSYGHPAPETLLRLRDYDIDIRRTDTEGTVLIRR